MDIGIPALDGIVGTHQIAGDLLQPARHFREHRTDLSSISRQLPALFLDQVGHARQDDGERLVAVGRSEVSDQLSGRGQMIGGQQLPQQLTHTVADHAAGAASRRAC